MAEIRSRECKGCKKPFDYDARKPNGELRPGPKYCSEQCRLNSKWNSKVKGAQCTRIVELWQEGLPASVIAVRFECSEKTVRLVLKRERKSNVAREKYIV